MSENPRNELSKIKEDWIEFPFYIRSSTLDEGTYREVFLHKWYDFNVKRTPGVIIDAGAHIGLVSIYLANKFPDSKIYAIEPEYNNFKLLKKNIASYKKIIPIRAALWNKNESIDVIDTGRGNNSFMTCEKYRDYDKSKEYYYTTEGMTVDSLMKKESIKHIDILKMDIEGAEKEVFTNCSSWINKVDTIIIELHERIKQGCDKAFYDNKKYFDISWYQGENIYAIRKRGVVCAPALQQQS